MVALLLEEGPVQQTSSFFIWFLSMGYSLSCVLMDSNRMDFCFLTKRYAFLNFFTALLCLSWIAWICVSSKRLISSSLLNSSFSGCSSLGRQWVTFRNRNISFNVFWHLGFNIWSYSFWYLKIFWMGRYPTTKYILSFVCELAFFLLVLILSELYIFDIFTEVKPLSNERKVSVSSFPS